MLTSDTDGLSCCNGGHVNKQVAHGRHTIIVTHVNKQTEQSAKNVVPRLRLLVSEHSYR